MRSVVPPVDRLRLGPKPRKGNRVDRRCVAAQESYGSESLRLVDDLAVTHLSRVGRPKAQMPCLFAGFFEVRQQPSKLPRWVRFPQSAPVQQPRP